MAPERRAEIAKEGGASDCAMMASEREITVPFSAYNGLFMPSELDLLERVLARARVARGIPPDDSVGAEILAGEILRARIAGVSTEDDLVPAVTKSGSKRLP
jgi:hypothetical protein